MSAINVFENSSEVDPTSTVRPILTFALVEYRNSGCMTVDVDYRPADLGCTLVDLECTSVCPVGTLADLECTLAAVGSM
jgi:hypothetical protein